MVLSPAFQACSATLPSELRLCSHHELRPPGDSAATEQPIEALRPGPRPQPSWSLTSNWISTVPLSRPFFSCSMDPSKVSPPSGQVGKMASGKSWFSSSSDLMSVNEWTAVMDKKEDVWQGQNALADPFPQKKLYLGHLNADSLKQLIK